MSDLVAGIVFFCLVAIPVVVASLTKVPVDEGHGEYTMGNSIESRQRAA